MITKEVLDVCPFDLDEPTKLWRAGTYTYTSFKPGVSTGLGFLSEMDAWEFRARFARQIKSVYSDPYETTLEELLADCRAEHRAAALIMDGTGRVIEEYPV
jgi:hypothetical protein